MKKPDMKHLLLAVMAVVAVFFACIPNAVTVYFRPQEGAEPIAPVTGSFFTLFEGVQGATSLPAAGLCACVTLLLVGIYLAIRKTGLLTAVKWLSFASAMLSCVLILIRSEDYFIVPNVMVPIAMMIEYGICIYMTKKQTETDKKTNLRRK